jgi:ABC-type transport system involved in multi-copper enzyme maturation permease subunit
MNMAKRNTVTVALLPCLFGFILLLLFIMLAWWMIGGILSITLGDLLIYAIMFGIGYAIGSNK